MTLTFDLDIQTRPSEGPNTSSLWIWRNSVQRFPRYLIGYTNKVTDSAITQPVLTQFTACGIKTVKIFLQVVLFLLFFCDKVLAIEWVHCLSPKKWGREHPTYSAVRRHHGSAPCCSLYSYSRSCDLPYGVVLLLTDRYSIEVLHSIFTYDTDQNSLPRRILLNRCRRYRLTCVSAVMPTSCKKPRKLNVM